VEEAEREVGVLRDELGQAQVRIETLLEMGQGSEDGLGVERSEEGSSEEASMAFDKVRKAVRPPIISAARQLNLL